jgi:hypothetical protein
MADQFTEKLGIHKWFTTPALAAAVMQLKVPVSKSQHAAIKRPHACIHIKSMQESRSVPVMRYKPS